jgi:hypothetical protein
VRSFSRNDSTAGRRIEQVNRIARARGGVRAKASIKRG